MVTLETFSDTKKVAQQFYCVCCDIERQDATILPNTY